MIPFINVAHAQQGQPNAFLPACATGPQGAGDLECVMELIVNIAQLLIRLTGTVMLAI